MHRKVIVMIPTYNEADNIGPLINKILAILPNCEILVVDDNSPDGTWQIVKGKADKNSRIKLLLREKDRGRGNAGITGFKYALKAGADYVIEMDGDFSHDPVFLPSILSAAEDSDVVLGSRYVKGGKDTRGRLRRVISMLAGAYIKTVLGYSVKDPTSGYRCFNSYILRKINLDTLRANDPFIVTDVLYRCYRENAKIAEVPIVFMEREKGSSKLGPMILLNNLWKVLRLRFLWKTP